MRRLLIVLALLGPLLWWGAEPAAACSCAIRSVPELVEDADVVVAARLVDRQADLQQAELTFLGVERYRGDVPRRFVVETAAQGASCGLTGLVEGQRYVVLADEDGGTFTASSCGGTGPAGPRYVAQVEAVTGPGTSFDLPPPGGDPPLPDGLVDVLTGWARRLGSALWS